MPRKAEKLGRGRKRCPGCGAINAARAVECKSCGYQFVKGGKPRASGKVGATATADDAAIQEVVNFIRQYGSVESARKVVEDVRQLLDKVGSMETIFKCFDLVSLIRENI
ncbi:hypothetical protein THTE_1481 [Thermogutta terrifontis]|jgi:ribosomal protein L40E|uniref:Uncharacterized protein n=1 Tax=Thermogutta terrifontis TaxID=1331910 RepID=A0A286RDR5_9BACT|nr:hypothetical protein [Thermogutta terrifontis]ASV74083.1 hypothetical protein THTE_1481 [Thermogutta terrifontis]